jgi:hypothetical protein
MISLGLTPNRSKKYFFNFQFNPIYKLDSQSTSFLRIYPYFSLPINYIWGEDDTNLKANNISITPQIGFELNIAQSAGKDYVVQLGYYLGTYESGWKSRVCSNDNSNCETINSLWLDAHNSKLDEKTIFLSFGIKNWNIDSKFW